MANYSQSLQASASERLLGIWKARYVAKVQTISTTPINFRTYPLEFAASNTGRQKTLEKLSDKLIKDASHAAAARTKRIYLQHEYLKFNTTVDLSKFTLKTVPVLLQYYQQQPPLIISSTQEEFEAGMSPKTQFGISEIGSLADHLETCFSEFKAQHSASKDWLIQCFLTSQISITSASLLAVLDPVEQAMFKPYCDLLEEYVSIPWSRLCAAATQYNQASRQYQLVERLLENSSNISLTAYQKLSQQFSSYAINRGGLNDLKIKRSALRDFDMFQVYLWLCLLQGNLDVIENELVIFCDYVFKGMGIPWRMVTMGTRLLLEEILSRLTADEKVAATQFLNGMMHAIEAVD
ncbi:MAG: hypothetical protein F6K31_42690 [Symploca sp. SIO2G7]|nr:hypothetical protein [Symploca sp. SIO2G7]